MSLLHPGDTGGVKALKRRLRTTVSGEVLFGCEVQQLKPASPRWRMAMLSISEHHSSPLNHHQHFSPVQIGGQASRDSGVLLWSTCLPPAVNGDAVQAGWARHSRVTEKAPAGSGFAQCRVVADAAPNSGIGVALGHSGTGVGGEVGGEVEEVLMLVVVVVVVRTRYR